MQSRDKIQVQKLNSAIVFVDAHPGILAELEEWFKALAPNYRWDPRYQQKYWDGYLRMFSHATQHLAIGLMDELYAFARRGGYTIELDWDDSHDRCRPQQEGVVPGGLW